MAESFLTQVDDFTLIDSSNAELNGVIFHNVQSVYTADEPVKCIYSITENVEPQAGDTIGLFKVGWVSSSEVYSSVAAKLPAKEGKTFLHTTFAGHQLPSDSTDLFQFCYITQKGIVGASTPFTFEANDYIAVEDPADPGLLVFKSRVTQLKDELLKLSNDRSFYASKYELLNQNFLKLKSEFDKLEEELSKEKEYTKLLEEVNATLASQLKELNGQLQCNRTVINETEIKDTENNCASDHISESSSIKSCEVIDNSKWKSLHKVFEAAVEVNQVLKLNNDCPEKISFETLINYILDIFTAVRAKLQIQESKKIDENQNCPCYFKQKDFCCPKLCTETQFYDFMTQPVYTCFSNISHSKEDGNIVCDGSFDSDSLKDYINSMKTPSDYSFSSSECTQNDTFNYSLFMKIRDERDKALGELKASKEKIATLNSRVNVLEIELVAQQSNKSVKAVPFNENKTDCFETVAFDIWETMLDSVNVDYIKLKDKYNELKKKIAERDSIEAKCALLEEENKKLLSYLSQKWDKKNKNEDQEQIGAELKTLLAEKKLIENKLVDLQKQAVGKISVNLIQHQEDQVFN